LTNKTDSRLLTAHKGPTLFPFLFMIWRSHPYFLRI